MESKGEEVWIKFNPRAEQRFESGNSSREKPPLPNLKRRNTLNNIMSTNQNPYQHRSFHSNNNHNHTSHRLPWRPISLQYSSTYHSSYGPYSYHCTGLETPKRGWPLCPCSASRAFPGLDPNSRGSPRSRFFRKEKEDSLYILYRFSDPSQKDPLLSVRVPRGEKRRGRRRQG